MKYIKMFAMVSVVSCGLSSTSWGMQEHPDLKKGDEVTSFCPLAKSLPYMELLEFMQRLPMAFFNDLVENFKKNDLVEIYRKDKDPFTLDIREILVFDVLLKVASLHNLANLAEFLIDKSNNMLDWNVLFNFENALSIAMDFGSDLVAALIIGRVDRRHHMNFFKDIVNDRVRQIFRTNNCDLAKKLFSNERFLSALKSSGLIKVVVEAINKSAELILEHKLSDTEARSLVFKFITKFV